MARATGNQFPSSSLVAGGASHRTPFRPDEERELLQFGCGITNFVARATAAADELARDEIVAGAAKLERKARRYRPHVVAVVGIGAYRVAFARPRAALGLQEERLADSALWVLPNTSGLNANYRPAELVALYRELREWVRGRCGR